MGYNYNGQANSGQYSRYQGQEQHETYTPHYQHGHPQHPPQPPARRSSFETGDDTTYLEGRGQEAGRNTGGGNIRMPDYSQYISGAGPATHNHIDNSLSYPSQGPADAQGAPYSHAPYNPQQYARTESQYGAPSYSSPAVNQSHNPAYQPYVPAAYHSTSPPLPNSSYGSYNPSNYFSPTAQTTPQLSTRMPYETDYGQGPQSSSYEAQQPSYAPHSPPQVSSPSSLYPVVYTPPAPPPPPPSSNVYGSHGNNYEHSSYRQSTLPPLPTAAPPAIHSRAGSLNSYPSHTSGSVEYSSSTMSQHNSTDPRPRRSAIAEQGSPQRTNTQGRHPQARPLPGPPPDAYDDNVMLPLPQRTESFGYDDILKEVEDAVMGRAPSAAQQGQSHRTERHVRHESIPEEQEGRPLHVNTATGDVQSKDVVPSSSGLDVNYGAYSDDSDAEAAAGLAAMQLAEEQDAADQARRSNGGMPAQSHYNARPSNLLPVPPKDDTNSSDSDIRVDMATFGGMYPGNVGYNYGTPIAQSYLGSQASVHRQSSAASTQRSDLSSERVGMPSGDYYLAGEESIHPFPAFGARTDTGGTGGLSEPSHERRLSFEDGDEATLVDTFDDASSGATSPTRASLRSRSSMQDPRGHHRANSRPLPSIPRRGAVDHQVTQRPLDQYGRPIYPQAPDEYEQSQQTGLSMQKANSVGSHSHTPFVPPPGRSVTDAEQRRRLAGVRTSVYDNQLSPDTASNNKYGGMDLPTIPAGKRRKFIPGKLSTSDYKKCAEPWAQSSILAWMKEMTEGETDLKEVLISQGLVALFTHKVPTMNTADAEELSKDLVAKMFAESALLKDEEWVKFGDNPMNGVIFQLTGTGCYSSRVHTTALAGRCYSHHCMRTLKKVNLRAQDVTPTRKIEDWVTFYKLKKEDITNASKREVERQNNLHEIVTSEDYFMDQINVLRNLYRDGLANSPDILNDKRRAAFVLEVFGKVDAIKQVNEDFLLAQLKYRQGEQGPWIKGFADIFREWIRKAKTAYIEYAANLPVALLKVRKEAEKNVLFRQFLDQVRDNELSKRLGWDTYLKAPITRLQRYSLLLATVYKHTEVENEEKTNLSTAIDEIKVVTLECDSKVAEMGKRSELLELQSKLRLRPGMEKVQLNLTHLGREIVFQGSLQRKGTNRVSWVDTHAILFDHYMVLAKPIQQRDAVGGLKHEVYDVSKLPIPMDLLVLESTNDDAVVKSSVKGIASVSAVSRSQTPQEARMGLGRIATNNSNPGSQRPGMSHANTETSTISSGSSKTLVTTTVLDSQNEKLMFPFRIKHLGKTETYVLYAPTEKSRTEWCENIIIAKTRHAASLFAQNAEPFRLRVMADTAFNYDSTTVGATGIVIKGTPLDRAIEECDRSFYGKGARPGPVCRSVVNCATTFSQPYGNRMVAVGTDFGVFISEYDNPRNWRKVPSIVASHITQIDVLEEFSLFLIIAEKSLIAYHLDSVVPVGGGSAPTADARRAPQKLSGNRDVGFFATGRMKDRMLVFYKKRDGISSNFKVLEPVYQKSATSTRSRFGLRKGTTDFFRDFDDFYVPSEAYAINLFQSSVSISTARGIEVLTLDKKLTHSIPDLRAPHVASIAARLQGQRPLGMFRLDPNEFLLVFEEVGIYVDKHGEVSRAVVMEFVGRARQATLFNSTYLVLVDAGGGFVEVRNAVNGRLRQVISGREVKMLDDGSRGGTVKICLQHPERDRVQLVVEMIVNEGLRE